MVTRVCEECGYSVIFSKERFKTLKRKGIKIRDNYDHGKKSKTTTTFICHCGGLMFEKKEKKNPYYL